MRIDGVTYQLDWEKFSIGSSFFIPCLNDVEGQDYIQRKMDRLGYTTIIKLVIEDGIRGLRVWRVNRLQSKRN